MHDTVFENNRIEINKAFYIVYLIYATKGEISSYQLEERLHIRQSTCWSYAIRIKAVMEQHKHLQKKNRESKWTDLILKA